MAFTCTPSTLSSTVCSLCSLCLLVCCCVVCVGIVCVCAHPLSLSPPPTPPLHLFLQDAMRLCSAVQRLRITPLQECLAGMFNTQRSYYVSCNPVFGNNHTVCLVGVSSCNPVSSCGHLTYSFLPKQPLIDGLARCYVVEGALRDALNQLNGDMDAVWFTRLFLPTANVCPRPPLLFYMLSCGRQTPVALSLSPSHHSPCSHTKRGP